jgi:TonB family protein
VNKEEKNKIRDYLEGNMSPEDRYALEKDSLNDPFLSDALEGLESVSSWKMDIQEIESRIQKRAEKKSIPLMIFWRPIAIAASILLLLGFGLYFLFKGSSKKPTIPMANLLKQNPSGTVSTVPNPSMGYIVKKSPTITNLIAKTHKEKPAKLPSEIDNKAFEKNYTSTLSKPDLSGSLSQIQPKTLPDTLKPFTDKAFASKPVNPNSLESEKKSPIYVSRTMLRVPSASSPYSSNNTSGLLSAKSKGLSLTETNGSLRKTSSGSDSLKALSEVVITMNGAPLDKNDDSGFPIPEGGIDHFHQYVLSEVKKDSGLHGTVTLEFDVLPDGKIDHIKVISSSNKKLNNKAKKILQNGPLWKGSSTGESKTLEEEIKFP